MRERSALFFAPAAYQGFKAQAVIVGASGLELTNGLSFRIDP